MRSGSWPRVEVSAAILAQFQELSRVSAALGLGLDGRFLSAVPAMAKRAARVARNVLCVGIDTEWRSTDGHLLSVQFAVRGPDGRLCSAVFYPPGPKIDAQALVKLLQEFLEREGLLPPVQRRQRRVALVAHFAAAELSMLTDALGAAKIRQIGKAHHARFPDVVDDSGITWRVQLLDLFAFYKASLAAIGRLIGLEKFEEDGTHLDELLLENRKRFERYATRDAEIAVVAFERFRSDILARWQIDPLTKPTLSSVAADIFRRHFMTTLPVPHKKHVLPVSRRSAKGWTERITTQLFYDGPREPREAALLSYAGGRVEAFVRGFVQEPVAEFDVVSLYPYAAILQPLPNCDTQWRQVTSLADLVAMEGFGTFEFRFPKTMQYPSLLVKNPGEDRCLFPLSGESHTTFVEVRTAIRLGATVTIVNAWGFVSGTPERDHDVGRYMRHWLQVKASSPRKTLAYENAKLFLNGLIGKFAERHRHDSILEVERLGRLSGHAGLGQVISSSPMLRDSLKGVEDVGRLWIPEWASLILGKARALMAGIVANGALLISTDSVIVPTSSTMIVSPELAELRAAGSDLLREQEGDAAFIARSRLYAILQRADNIRPDVRVIAQDKLWAVVRVARHGTPESETQFAQTVLACLAARRDVAPQREKTQLLSAGSAARKGLAINDEVTRKGKTYFTWDKKRRLLDRDLNIFVSYTPTAPYLTAKKLRAAERESLVRKGELRKRRQERAPAVLDRVLELLEAGTGVREISRITGVPKSTVSDLKKRFHPQGV